MNVMQHHHHLFLLFCTKFPIAKVTISEQDEKVGRRFFALILLQQILFSSVSFHVFLPVVEYNQLLLS
jgi:hypothetical protein